MSYPLQKHIKTSVVACIIDAERRILLTKRSIPPFYGQWVMPGGKIDHGETIHQALKREVEEEVGLQVSVDSLIDVYEHIGIGHREDHYIILYYRSTPQTFKLNTNPDELSEARWFNASQLLDLDVPPGSRHILSILYPEQLWRDFTTSGDDAECEIPGVCPIK
ncbi:MAG: DNA mismatch repair protein MutT [Desulfobacteraceae bacterium 4572_35.1]|nr:MAG: DNA mismatch repair protein MutT [Desulfobacteraceae bacterium 4572_35.1]